VNAYICEFPNAEVNAGRRDIHELLRQELGFYAADILPLCSVKHSITRYRITLEAFAVSLANSPAKLDGVWKTPAELKTLAFPSAHKKLASAAAKSILFKR
jgi:A/G-specific adenine glycosylase